MGWGVRQTPSHDKKVLELLKELGLKRPVKDENYDGVSILEELEDESGYLTFDEDCETQKQKERAYGNVDFYLNGISVKNSDLISPPLVASKIFCKFFLSLLRLYQIIPRNILSIQPLGIGVNR